MPADLNNVEQFTIVAATQPEAPARVLKQGDTFMLFDRLGDVNAHGPGELGLYRDDTRYLSFFELRLGPLRPLLLSSEIARDNSACTIDLTNADLTVGGRIALPRGSLHLRRFRFLWHGVLYEQVRVTNYGADRAEAVVTFRVDADFVDIFEVRGTGRVRRGVSDGRVDEGGALIHDYIGLDHIRRTMWVVGEPTADRASATALQYTRELAPGEHFAVEIRISCGTARDPAARGVRSTVALEASLATPALMTAGTRVDSSRAPLNDWVARSAADVDMLLTDTPEGPYPFAGVPWYSTVFGRDGILTAYQLLWVQPAVARGVLRYLAAHQADAFDDARDAQPGKILHESREGEMARLGEVPFRRYYGSVDATPLFVLLAGAYYRRTADVGLIREIWPHLQRALEWMERHGDVDGDGFIEYARRSATGLVQQGWKDSHDSVRHADGSIAPGPIALCEVQAYAYGAWMAGAELGVALGQGGDVERCRRAASRLADEFERAFWCDEIGTYALALDGHKRRCEVRTSNAGQCLLTGMVRLERGRKVAETLMGADAFSGWGIRTVSAAERFFNPMSYHNGSVWPHDNSIIAGGFARYGRTDLALAVLEGLFDATRHLELQRLPELFCGFERRRGEGPTQYPVACSPQAWAAAAVFLMLQATLGLSIDAPARTVMFSQPRLPESVERLYLANLTVGQASLDLICGRHAHDVNITVMRRHGDVKVVVTK